MERTERQRNKKVVFISTKKIQRKRQNINMEETKLTKSEIEDLKIIARQLIAKGHKIDLRNTKKL